MLKRVILSLVFLMLGQSLAVAEEAPLQFFAEGFLHWVSIDGTVQWSESDVLGTEIDLDSAFGFDNTPAWAGKAGVILYRRHEFLLDFRRYQFSKDSTLNSTILFGETTIPADLPISPELRFQTVSLFYGYRFIDADSGYIAIRPGVAFVDYEVEISSNLFGFQIGPVSYSDDTIAPFVTLAGEYRIHPLFSLAGEFSGGWLDEQAGYLFQPLLKMTPHPNISAVVGYSHLWYRNETGNNLFDVTLPGPVVGVYAVW